MDLSDDWTHGGMVNLVGDGLGDGTGEVMSDGLVWYPVRKLAGAHATEKSEPKAPILKVSFSYVYFNPTSLSNRLITSTADVDHRQHSQDMVTFVVGPENNQKTFLVHKHLASVYSPFFKAAFESPMVEGATQSMRLELSVSTFGALVHWLYTQEIEDGFGYTTNSKDVTVEDLNFIAHANLWKLAERALIPSLQNKVMDVMLRNGRYTSNENILNFVYFLSSGELEAPLGRLAMYLITWEYAGQRFADMADSLTPEMLLKVSKSLSLEYTRKNNTVRSLDRKAVFVPLD